MEAVGVKVEEVMNRSVLTVTPEQTLDEAAKIICDHKMSGLPVVDERGGVIGILSEKDILRAMYPSYAEFTANPTEHMDFEAMELRCVDLFSIRVRDAMRTNPVTVPPDCPVLRAASLMVLRRFRRLPVVDEGKLVGIVSQGDVHCAVISCKLRER